MKVTLKLIRKDGSTCKSNTTMTCKQARHLYRSRYQNDDDVVEVYLTYFDGWHEQVHRILKKKKDR